MYKKIKKRMQKINFRKVLPDYALLTIGSLISAANFDIFLAKWNPQVTLFLEVGTCVNKISLIQELFLLLNFRKLSSYFIEWDNEDIKSYYLNVYAWF